MTDPHRPLQTTPIDYVFLDRDGVINRKLAESEYVTRCQDLELLPGAAAAIASLNRSGRKVIVVTNQRGVALNRMSEAELAEVHDSLRTQLARAGATLDAIYSCPHDRGVCRCRKPQTGMIEAAFRDFPGAAPENSIFIGDSLSDIQCGHNAGMATILIGAETAQDKGERQADGEAAKALADRVAYSLSDAVRLFL